MSGMSMGHYPTTSWTLMDQARKEGTQGALARERFVGLYRGPVLAYLTARFCFSKYDPEELTQDFFLSKVFLGKILSGANRKKGRFRHFLKQCLRNYAADVLRRHEPAEPLEDERLGRLAAVDPWFEVERAFHLEWVRGLLGRSLLRVRSECEARSQMVHFELFRRRFLENPEDYPPWQDVGSGVQTEEGRQTDLDEKEARRYVETVLRHYRKAIREELAGETGSRDSAEEEIATLFAMFAEGRR